MDELLDYIETKRPGIEIGATSNLIEPRGYIFSDRLTYIAGEYGHPYEVDTSPGFEPIMHYKAAEDLDKTLIYFPYPKAFQELRARNAPRQARAWIAQAYAMGSIFTIPGKVWVGGSETWDMGWENHADIYEFVHDNSELFDDYEALSNVSLAYSVYASLRSGGMNGSIKTLESVEYLIKQNISFDMKIFGDPDRPIAPTEEELDRYDVIVHDSDIQYLTIEQNQILNSNNNIVSINSPNDITNNLSWKIDVLSDGEIRNNLISALPRISPDDEAAPYVLHLINRKYNASEDNAQTHNGISVKIPTVMFQNSILAAKLHMPGKPSIDLPFQTNNSGIITLNIGTFNSCWGIIEFTHDYILSNENVNFNSETISLYPNPANKYITIKNDYAGEISSIEIYNIQGKQIMKSKKVNSNPINISILADGVYMVKINNYSGNTVIEKLIKN